jgi:hypothetical protein
MQTQQPNVSADQIREQVEQAVSKAQAAAEKAAAERAATAARPGATITTSDGKTIVLGPGGGVGTSETRAFNPDDIPPRAENVAISFFVVVGAVIIGLPLMRAIARRIERGTPQAAALSPEMRNQLQQISSSVDAIAIEVERISEAQRFQSRLLAEKAPDSTVLTPRAER